MGKSSIHISAAKMGSEEHNSREKELDYVRKEWKHKNLTKTDQKHPKMIRTNQKKPKLTKND